MNFSIKKIGFLFGQENTCPPAFVERVDSKKEDGITSEFVKINKVEQVLNCGYDVIIDRMSQMSVYNALILRVLHLPALLLSIIRSGGQTQM